MVQSQKRRKIVVLGVLIAISVIASAVLASRRPRDFAVYMRAADRIVNGEQIYRSDDDAAFTYPPFFALPYTPLLVFPPRVQLFLWSLTNCALLIATIQVVVSWVEPFMQSGASKNIVNKKWVWLTVAVLSGRYLISPLEYQAHDLIVLLLVLVGGRALARSREYASGAWYGLAAACKATPLLFLPALAGQRRWRGCIALVLALAGATLLPDLLFPSNSGKAWVVSWYENFVSKVSVGASPEAGGAWARWDILNQSLSGSIYRLTTPLENRPELPNVCVVSLDDAQRRYVTLAAEALVLGILAVALWPGRKVGSGSEDQSFRRFGEVGAVLCGMLLLSPMSSKHHFCALIVPITFCVVHFAYHRRDYFVASSLGFLFLIGTLGAKDLAGDTIGNWLQACGSLAMCAGACLLSTSWVLWTERSLIGSNLRQDEHGEEVSPAVARDPLKAAA